MRTKRLPLRRRPTRRARVRTRAGRIPPLRAAGVSEPSPRLLPPKPTGRNGRARTPRADHRPRYSPKARCMTSDPRDREPNPALHRADTRRLHSSGWTATNHARRDLRIRPRRATRGGRIQSAPNAGPAPHSRYPGDLGLTRPLRAPPTIDRCPKKPRSRRHTASRRSPRPSPRPARRALQSWCCFRIDRC